MPSVWQPWKVTTRVLSTASVTVRRSGSGTSTWLKYTETSPKCSSRCDCAAGQRGLPASTPALPSSFSEVRSRYR
jgi:hypothetical protein